MSEFEKVIENGAGVMNIIEDFVAMDTKAKLLIHEKASLLGYTCTISERTSFAVFDDPIDTLGLIFTSCPVFGNRVFSK